MYLHLNQLPDTSRLWFFYDDKPWSEEITSLLSEDIRRFCEQWKAHDLDVPSSFEVLDNQIIIVAADNNTPVTGCANDALTHTIVQIQNKYNINPFSRKIIVYQKKKTSGGNAPLELKSSYTLNEIKKTFFLSLENNATDDIFMLDTTIKALQDKKMMIKKIEDSWIFQKVTG